MKGIGGNRPNRHWKTLNAPYDSGLFLCRDRDALIAALQASGSYILQSDKRDPMFYTFEMGRRARAIEVWAILKTLGRQGVEDLVDQLCSHAEYFAQCLTAEGIRIVNDVVFNQVLIAGETEKQTKELLEKVQNSGEIWCGGTVWNNEAVIRFSVCSWATTREDIIRAVEVFKKAKGEVSA